MSPWLGHTGNRVPIHTVVNDKINVHTPIVHMHAVSYMIHTYACVNFRV